MSKWIVAAAALLIAGCSQGGGPQESQDSGGIRDLAEAPDVSPTAAPGVAFRYFYRFELPDEGISAVQEKHASRCESLGVSRCRITGLNYSVNDDNAVSASLTVKLAPEIARQFGKDAAADVKQADGRLQSTEFTGEDTEPVTTEASRQQSDIQPFGRCRPIAQRTCANPASPQLREGSSRAASSSPQATCVS